MCGLEASERAKLVMRYPETIIHIYMNAHTHAYIFMYYRSIYKILYIHTFISVADVFMSLPFTPTVIQGFLDGTAISFIDKSLVNGHIMALKKYHCLTQLNHLDT